MRVLQEMEVEHPDKEIPVIITLEPGSEVAILEASMTETRRFGVMNAISGKVNVRDVRGLAELTQVRKIEYDGEVRIL